MLYDLVACPHRVTMDLYGYLAKRDQPNPFVKMLWERGSLFEREVIAGLELHAAGRAPDLRRPDSGAGPARRPRPAP